MFFPFRVIIRTDYNRFTYFVVAESGEKAEEMALERHMKGVFGSAVIRTKEVLAVNQEIMEVLGCDQESAPKFS